MLRLFETKDKPIDIWVTEATTAEAFKVTWIWALTKAPKTKAGTNWLVDGLTTLKVISKSKAPYNAVLLTVNKGFEAAAIWRTIASFGYCS